MEQKQHGDTAKATQENQAAHRILLGFKLPAQPHEVPLSHRSELFADRLNGIFDVPNHSREISSLHIARNDHPSLAILPVQHIRTGRIDDIHQLTQRQSPPGSRLA